MRIIPKKIKVKNTVWKCYSMTDVVVALFVFALIFIAVTAGNWAFAIVMGLIAVVMFMPTPDGIFYTCIFENVKFLFAKKRYTADAKNPKENIDTLLGLKEIKTNGLLAYNGGMYGRVIKIGQKNFGIEDVVQQNIDINYIANALKLLDANQSADIIKIDRPVNLDGFAKDIFDKLSALHHFHPTLICAICESCLQEKRMSRIVFRCFVFIGYIFVPARSVSHRKKKSPFTVRSCRSRRSRRSTSPFGSANSATPISKILRAESAL